MKELMYFLHYLSQETHSSNTILAGWPDTLPLFIQLLVIDI